MALLCHLSRIFQFFNLYTTFKNWLHSWEIRLCWPIGVRLPKIVCTSLVQSSIWISPSVWFLAAKGYILMHSRLSTRQGYDRRVQWREIRGWRTIHVESLVYRHRWTDFYVCKSGLHCSKMFMLKCSWFFEYLNSYTFLLQTCIQYLRVCAPTLCAECKMPSVM
jgi:hypothetical protein